jgi:hypothetical protein
MSAGTRGGPRTACASFEMGTGSMTRGSGVTSVTSAGSISYEEINGAPKRLKFAVLTTNRMVDQLHCEEIREAGGTKLDFRVI